MRAHRPGFTLIELTVSMTIASIMSLAVFSVLNQMTRASTSIGGTLDYVQVLSCFYDQLGQDVTAIFVPERSFEQFRILKKQKAEGGKGQDVGKDKEKGSEKKEDHVPPPFFVQAKDNQVSAFGFISTTRLPRYKFFTPYNSRIVYRVVPDEMHEKLFKIERAESSDLRRPLNDFLSKEVKGQVIIDRVKSLSMKLYVPEEPKEKTDQGKKNEKGEGATKGPKPEEKIIYKIIPDWDPEKMEKEPYLIPAYVEISGEYVDGSGKQVRPFNFAFKIGAFKFQYEQCKVLLEERTKEQKQQEKTSKTDGAEGEKKSPGRAKQPQQQQGLGRRASGRPGTQAGGRNAWR